MPGANTWLPPPEATLDGNPTAAAAAAAAAATPPHNATRQELGGVRASLSPGLIALVVVLVLVATSLVGAYCYTQTQQRALTRGGGGVNWERRQGRHEQVHNNAAFDAGDGDNPPYDGAGGRLRNPAYDPPMSPPQPAGAEYATVDEPHYQVPGEVKKHAALDADGYVIDTYFQQQHGGPKRHTVTAQTPQGSVYAIPFEDGANLPASSNSSIDAEQEPGGRSLASRQRILPNSSYEEVPAVTAGGPSSQPRLSRNAVSGGAGGKAGDASKVGNVPLSAKSNRAQQHRAHQKHQQSVYLGFEEDSNETDDV